MNRWILGIGLIVFGALRIVLTRQAKARVRGQLPPPRAKLHEALASMTDGDFVQLTGKLQPATEALAAALSGTPCVAYVAVAQVWHSKKIPQLIAEVRVAKAQPLVLVVTDGEVILDGDCELEWPTTPLSPRAPDREAAFLASRKLERYLRFTEFQEGVVRSGDQVWVRGVAVRDQGNALGYRESPVRTRLVARPDRPLTIGRPRR
jgi:hypothetical protein